MNLGDVEIIFSPAQNLRQSKRKINGFEAWDDSGGRKNVFLEQAGDVMSAPAQTFRRIVHDIRHSAFRLVGSRCGDYDPHLCGDPLSRDHKIVLRKGTQETTNRAVRFQPGELNGIPAGNKWELMNGSIGSNNFPSRSSYKIADLREKKPFVKRLRRLQAGMPDGSVNQVKPHEVQIVRGRQIEHASGLADAVHFAHGRARIRNVLDRFAGNDEVKSIFFKGHVLRVGLHVADTVRDGWVAAQSFLRDVHGGGRKIRAAYRCAPRTQKPREAAPAACNFQDSLVLDRRQEI